MIGGVLRPQRFPGVIGVHHFLRGVFQRHCGLLVAHHPIIAKARISRTYGNSCPYLPYPLDRDLVKLPDLEHFSQSIPEHLDLEVLLIKVVRLQGDKDRAAVVVGHFLDTLAKVHGALFCLAHSGIPFFFRGLNVVSRVIFWCAHFPISSAILSRPAASWSITSPRVTTSISSPPRAATFTRASRSSRRVTSNSL